MTAHGSTITRPEWEGQVRAWARDVGATHALVEACGPRKRLRIASCIGRVARAHPDLPLIVTVLRSLPHTVQLRDPDTLAMVAQISEPTRHEHTGRYDHRGYAIYEHRPVI